MVTLVWRRARVQWVGTPLLLRCTGLSNTSLGGGAAAEAGFCLRQMTPTRASAALAKAVHDDDKSGWGQSQAVMNACLRRPTGHRSKRGEGHWTAAPIWHRPDWVPFLGSGFNRHSRLPRVQLQTPLVTDGRRFTPLVVATNRFTSSAVNHRALCASSAACTRAVCARAVLEEKKGGL